MPAIRFILISFLFVFCSLSLVAQTDTEFWFAAPEVSYNTDGQDRPIRLFVTTYGQKATVYVLRPAIGDTLTSIRVAADFTESLTLTKWIDSIEAKPPNTVLPFGLLIVSSAPVTIYYEVVSGLCDCNPEMFILKGHNALGTDFWIPAQNMFDNAISSPLAYSSFDLVATENSTHVTITPADNIQGHSTGLPFTVVLDKGEVYSATAATRDAAGHLAGSRVTATKPIAITVKDDQLWLGPGTCADLTGDQIVPVSLLGKEYIAVNGYLDTSDHLFITAIANNTQVYQNGGLVATINAGETHHIAMNTPATYITSSEKVYVLQVSGVGCELGSTLLPTLGCTGSYSVSFSKSASTPLYVNLLTATGGQGTFLVNGAPGVIMPSQFLPVPGTGGAYHYARVPLPSTQGATISITNTSKPFHLGMLHGSEKTGARFGYFSNYGNIVPIVWTNSPICENDSIVLNTHLINGAVYTWNGPGGFSSNVHKPFIHPAPFSASGVYTLKMDANGCSGSIGLGLEVLPKPIIHVTPSVSFICPKDSMVLTASGTDTFYWNPPLSLDTNVGPVVKASPDVNTTYVIKGVAENECFIEETVEVRIKVVPGIKITPDTVTICPKGSTYLVATGASEYSWEPSTGLNTATGPLVLVAGIDGEMRYIVTGVATNGCMGKDTALVIVDDTVSVYRELFVCSDDSLIFGTMVISDSGTYVHNFKTRTGCDSVVTLYVGFNEAPTADFYFDPIIPELNKATQFTNLSVGAEVYKWDFGDGYYSNEENPLYLFKRSGIFNVCLTARNEKFCPHIICKPIEAEIYPNVNVPGAFSPNGDGINDILFVYGGAVEEVHFRVYNRWGQIVFESNSLDKGWDGTFRGDPQVAEVYAYTVYATFIDGVQYSTSGNITLIR